MDTTDQADSGAGSEDALRRAAERYRQLFESHPIAMAVWDRETTRVLAVNAAAVRMYGYSREEFLGLTIERIVHPGDRHELKGLPRAAEGFLGAATTIRHRRKDGTTIAVEMSGHDLEYDGRPASMVVAVNVTERRKLEDELRESQRMEAIGRLAGGIAHDFNNLLTAINGYSQLLLNSLEPGDPRRDDAEQIHLAGVRAASLTSRLLAFSRRQLLQPEVVDLNLIVRDIVPMVRRLIGARIDLRLNLRARHALVLADRARLEQVVVNLCVNARDAMVNGGILRIGTVELELRSQRRLGEDIAAAGRYIVLRVVDTGMGMDEAVRERLFEPFFTTKEAGRGTGLGLATVYGTVRQSGGHLQVTSSPGKGTSFRIYLPRSGPEMEMSEPSVRPSAPAVDTERGLILLVDDEPTILSLAERVLSEAGFPVMVASDVAAAQRIIRRHGHRIVLAVTDLVMPDGTGHDVARRLTRSHPAARVLFTSGYADGAIIQDGVIDREVAFLPKPFSADELLSRVRGLLSGVAHDH
ncbi:MAG: PAS domain S-box protein [Chloroflexota bacterium]|nr:PAS domain S-box protein [Chloroflexota bacterium]